MPDNKDFRYEIADQAFEPNVEQLAREESSLRVSSRFSEPRTYRTEAQMDEHLLEEIVKAEHRLITLRYLLAVREARKSDGGWLRKTLGWGKH